MGKPAGSTVPAAPGQGKSEEAAASGGFENRVCRITKRGIGSEFQHRLRHCVLDPRALGKLRAISAQHATADLRNVPYACV